MHNTSWSTGGEPYAATEQQYKLIPGSAFPTLRRGLRILAGLDMDGARELNGEGFNKMDTAIGNDLARQNYLSQAQGKIAVRLLRKYRRQLPEDVSSLVRSL